MIQEGLVSSRDVTRALDLQKKSWGKRFKARSQLLGMVLCKRNLITPLDNFYVLKKHNKLMSVTDRLSEKKLLPRSRLEKIRTESERKSIPFISFLLEKQIISQARLQQVLFDLFGIPLRPVSDILFNQSCRSELTKVIDRTLADKHCIIPLHLSGNILTLGLTDPDNLIFVRELNAKFPQYRFLPIFIHYSGFKWFYPILYPKTTPMSPPMFTERQPPPQKNGDSAGLEAATSPTLNKHVIARLFRQYETFRLGHDPRNNHEIYNYRLALFTQFIRDSYYEITGRNNSKTIQFYIQEQEGRAMVIAKSGDKNRKGKEQTT